MGEPVDTNNEEKTQETKQKKKKSLIGRIFRVVLGFFAAVILINLLLYILLSIPAIQNKLVGFAAGRLEQRLNTRVSIDEIQIRLFDHLWVKGIYIEDQKQDTLLYAGELDVRINPLRLLNNRLLIKSLSIGDLLVNVNRSDSASGYNFQFIIDAFAGDTTVQADTTSSSMKIAIHDVSIQNGRLNYDIFSVPLTPGIFNPSHIHISGFNAGLDIKSVDPKALDIALDKLTAKEESGLEITSLKGKVFSKGSRFWGEGLSLSLPCSELVLGRAEYNTESNEFALTTQKGEVLPLDVKPFFPRLENLKYPVIFDASITGRLPMVNLENIEITYGGQFSLKGSAYLGSYEDYGDADAKVQIESLKISPEALTDFVRLADPAFVAPEVLANWGTLYMKGQVDGKLSGFTAGIEAWGRQGTVSVDARGSAETTFNRFDVSARLDTRGINLGNLLGAKTGLGRLAMHVSLNANQTAPPNLTARMNGVIDRLQYRDSIDLRNIAFSGFYNPREMGASINGNLSIAKLRAEASMTRTAVPDVKFDIDLDSLLVDRFYNNPNWKNPILSLNLNGNVRGLDIDKMTGKVFLDNLYFRGDDFEFRPGRFSLELIRGGGQDKQITLYSPILSAKISGYYTFASIAGELSSILYGYLPGLLPPSPYIRKWQNDFTVDVKIKDTEKISQIFRLPFDAIEPVSINGRVNTIGRDIEFRGKMPHIAVNGMSVKGASIALHGEDSSFQVTAKASLEMEKGSYNFDLGMEGRNNEVHTLLSAANSDTVFNVNGTIETMLRFAKDGQKNRIVRLDVYPTYINLGNLKLQMLPAVVTNSGRRTEINNFGIAIAPSGKKYVGIDGVISGEETDSLRLWFDRAQVGDLLTAFNINTIKAEIDGNIMIRNMRNKPELLTNDFKISDIIIFADTLGTLYLDSRWNNGYTGIKVSSSLKKSGRDVVTIDGMVYPRRDSLDMKVDVDRFAIDWAQPFVADALDRLSGTLSMGMKIDGKLSAPDVSGFLGVNDAAVGIEYTNVTYFVSDTIDITPDHAGFRNLRLTDSEGNQANVNATITHQGFRDIKYSLDMRIPQRLLVLNTATRTDSLFYGRVYASGTVNIEGSNEGINMNMKIRNGNNSNINITVPQVSQATQYRSVVFINVPEELLAKEAESAASRPLPLRMNINLEVTPEFQVGILLDPSTNTTLRANGRGLINFAYDMERNNMTVFGDYTLQEGSVRLNLEGIRSFEFIIREGSRLRFVGDPMNTNFDIVAFRRVRADLRTLSSSFEAVGNTRVSVDCVVSISGNINKMELTYDVSLPDADDDTRRKLNSLISTEEERIRQFAYLLATGSFYSLSGGGGGNITDGMWTNLASSTLSGALNAMFSSILGDNWEVGTNFDSNDGTFSDMDMSVNVSTRLFNDRLRLRTNVGYRNDAFSSSQSEFVGDFEAEYQLSKSWTLKAFNRTNDRYYRQAPYTQGIGIVYTKEAKTLKQLFQSFRPRRRGSRGQNAVSREVNPASVETQQAAGQTEGSK